MRKVSIYSMKLGDSGIIKVGYCYTDRLRERATEHGRRFGIDVKTIEVLSHADFNSKATAQAMELKLIEACGKAGLVMFKDVQNGDTERFYADALIKEVSVKARKLTYNLKVF